MIKNRWEEIKLFQLDGWLQKQSDTQSFPLHLMCGLMGLPYGRFIHLVKIPISCFWTTGKSMSFFFQILYKFYPGSGSEFQVLSKFFLNSYQVGSKECYLLPFKELLLNRITQPPEISLNTFFYLCVCFFLYVSIQ